MDKIDLKTSLICLLDQASREEQSFVATLSNEERGEEGSPERWSTKDILIHIAAWKERMVESLDAAVQGKTCTAFDDFDKSNAEIFQAHRRDPWKEVIEHSERASEILAIRIQALEIDDFARTRFLSWQRDRPLWRLIVMNGFYHPIDHLARYYARQENRQEGRSYASQIEEEAAELMTGLDDDPEWQGTVAYNLACFYAQAGEKEKAGSILEGALRQATALLEWSKQDPDLALLREETVL